MHLVVMSPRAFSGLRFVLASSLTTLTVVESTGHLFCKVLPSWDFSEVPLLSTLSRKSTEAELCPPQYLGSAPDVALCLTC